MIDDRKLNYKYWWHWNDVMADIIGTLAVSKVVLGEKKEIK